MNNFGITDKILLVSHPEFTMGYGTPYQQITESEREEWPIGWIKIDNMRKTIWSTMRGAAITAAVCIFVPSAPALYTCLGLVLTTIVEVGISISNLNSIPPSYFEDKEIHNEKQKKSDLFGMLLKHTNLLEEDVNNS